MYLIPLTDWDSNVVLVTKKYATICVCSYYRDINMACPKYNYPTPFINQIVDDCTDSEIFSFIDGYFGYNHIDILPSDNQKNTSIFSCHP